MPIEYEMMYLKQTVEDAVRKFSEDTWSAAWLIGVEETVLDMVENNPNALSLFQDYQVAAMRELVSRGYWIKWDEALGRPILTKINR